MEIRQLHLDKENATTVHGDIYGLDYSVEEPGFKVKYYLDIFNQRIRVTDYVIQDTEDMVRTLDYLAQNNDFGKVTINARPNEWEWLLPYGFVLEGVLKYYFNGEHAYCLSKFYNHERRVSKHFDKETEILEAASKVEVEPLEIKLEPGFKLREAGQQDIEEIAALYNKIFKTYPLPLDQSQYVKQLMDDNYLFMVITHQGKIISSASADINYSLANAEITDCASLPDYRGKGLMFTIIAAMEQEVKKRGVTCVYSLARALSPGMNTVFNKLGYTYTGRLVNNCNIFGKFEDMNLWVKGITGAKETL